MGSRLLRRDRRDWGRSLFLPAWGETLLRSSQQELRATGVSCPDRTGPSPQQSRVRRVDSTCATAPAARASDTIPPE